MADKVFTTDLAGGSPSVHADVVIISNGGDAGTAVTVTVGEGLTLAEAEERFRAFLRAWHRAASKVTSVAGIATGTTTE